MATLDMLNSKIFLPITMVCSIVYKLLFFLIIMTDLVLSLPWVTVYCTGTVMIFYMIILTNLAFPGKNMPAN